jgi:hypothetical protein
MKDDHQRADRTGGSFKFLEVDICSGLQDSFGWRPHAFHVETFQSGFELTRKWAGGCGLGTYSFGGCSIPGFGALTVEGGLGLLRGG